MVNPTAWAHVPSPGIRSGVSQGLEATAMGAQSRRADTSQAFNIEQGLAETARRGAMTDIAQDQNIRAQEAHQVEMAEEERRLAKEKGELLILDEWKQAQKAGDDPASEKAYLQLRSINPKLADGWKSTFGSLKWQDMGEIGRMVEAATLISDVEAQNKLLGDAQRVLAEKYPDHPFIQSFDDMMGEQDEKERDRKMLYTTEVFRNYGALPKAKTGETKQKTRTYLVKLPDGDTKLMTGVFDPKGGGLTLEGAEFPEGAEVVGEYGETATEKKLRTLETAEEKKMRESREGRAVEVIERGAIASNSLPRLRASLKLLNDVETGGFEGMKLRASQFLGMESADEAELSQNLMKNVLAQLKPTFGAAFTAREGEWLKSVEPNISKSTEGNKRLLLRTIKEYEKQARRALVRAKAREDWETVDEIEENLSAIEEAQEAAAATPAAAAPATAEGSLKQEVINEMFPVK